MLKKCDELIELNYVLSKIEYFAKNKKYIFAIGTYFRISYI